MENCQADSAEFTLNQREISIISVLFFLTDPNYRLYWATISIATSAMMPNELLDHRDEILRLAAYYGATDVRVFGSVARGEAQADSDVDFLVRLEPVRSIFDQAALVAELEALLGRPVDVVPDDAIYWLLRRRVLSEAQPL